ncbi:DinB family protein [Zobellia uliginosa]|uniref:DinB family protein n=1 Tax=Zobellia uliginosa TaxID=143224 RepID=UPI001C06CE23|nr:DinB family protein [Zobellia uliginosa]MBU2948504.1 DinB family protein [Zobellia uliginosa]
MEKLFDVILQNRKRLYKILEETPKEQLLEIPKGFNNNIWWNIAHTLVTPQVLAYKFSNLQMRVPDEFVVKFSKGTKPDGTATKEEMMIIADFLISTLEWLVEDYEAGLFQEYTEYTTSAGVTLTSVEEAVAFTAYHEGLHMGAIIALLKIVAK